MSPYALVVVSLAVLSVYFSLAQSAGLGYAQEVVDKNNFDDNDRVTNRAFNPQRRNSKSMSFMDYLFPSSRNAKVANNFPQDRSEHNVVSSSTIRLDDKEETTARVSSTSSVSEENSTIDEGRATRKSTTAGKKKTSSRLPSTTPKTKLSSKVTEQSTSWSSSSVSNKATTVKPVTKQGVEKLTTLGGSSQKTTHHHKHYTVYPSVMTTKISSSSSSIKNKQPESTTIGMNSEPSSQSDTTSEHRVTLSDLAKVSESVTKQSVELENSVDSNDNKDLDSREGQLDLREKPSKHSVQIVEDPKKEVPLPDGSTSMLAKPTKYHYYPHNQHIYLLPECAIQQVCNAVYVRLNFTQPLCACPARHRDPCSASLNADDQHTTRLTTDSKKKYANKAITLVKTCEAVTEMRECRAPRDWSLLALQNIRTGKSHYLVICRCPEEFTLEGPMSHDQPTYASVPGIRVYGMMCVQSVRHATQGYVSVTARPSTPSYQVSYSQPHYNSDGYTRYPGYIGPGVYYNRMARMSRNIRSVDNDLPPIPWDKVKELVENSDWEN